MKPGCPVIAGESIFKQTTVQRYYGIVQESSGDCVRVLFADGTTGTFLVTNVAAYISPPPDWDELYQQQCITVKRQRMVGPVQATRMTGR